MEFYFAHKTIPQKKIVPILWKFPTCRLPQWVSEWVTINHKHRQSSLSLKTFNRKKYLCTSPRCSYLNKKKSWILLHKIKFFHSRQRALSVHLAAIQQFIFLDITSRCLLMCYKKWIIPHLKHWYIIASHLNECP